MIHFDRRAENGTGAFGCARTVRSQAAARSRRRQRLQMGRPLHADPPPPWLARVMRAMGHLPQARVRAAAVDHRVRRNPPKAASFLRANQEEPLRLRGGIVARAITWWYRQRRRLSDWWWSGW
jgi:hypothetical protein